MSDGSLPADESPRGRWRLAVQVLLSLVLLGLLAAILDWEQFWTTIRRADPLLIVASVCMDGILIGLSAWRWQVLFERLGPRVPFGKLLRLYLAGMFLNHFLPTSVGGDIGRSLGVSRETGSGHSAAFASVLTERFIGFGVFIFAALLLLPWMHQRLGFPWVVTGLIAGAALAFTIVAILLLTERIPLLPSALSRMSIFRKLGRLRSAISSYRNHRDGLATAILISLVAFVVAVGNLLITARAFGARVTVLEGTLGTPLITLGALVPFSLGGLGVIEGIYAYFFDGIGFPVATGLAVALVMRIKGMLFGAVGALVIPGALDTVLSRERAPESTIQDTLDT